LEIQIEGADAPGNFELLINMRDRNRPVHLNPGCPKGILKGNGSKRNWLELMFDGRHVQLLSP
jgi:hypothetical protein